MKRRFWPKADATKRSARCHRRDGRHPDLALRAAPARSPAVAVRRTGREIDNVRLGTLLLIARDLWLWSRRRRRWLRLRLTVTMAADYRPCHWASVTVCAHHSIVIRRPLGIHSWTDGRRTLRTWQTRCAGARLSLANATETRQRHKRIDINFATLDGRVCNFCFRTGLPLLSTHAGTN